MAVENIQLNDATQHPEPFVIPSWNTVPSIPSREATTITIQEAFPDGAATHYWQQVVAEARIQPRAKVIDQRLPAERAQASDEFGGKILRRMGTSNIMKALKYVGLFGAAIGGFYTATQQEQSDPNAPPAESLTNHVYMPLISQQEASPVHRNADIEFMTAGGNPTASATLNAVKHNSDGTTNMTFFTGGDMLTPTQKIDDIAIQFAGPGDSGTHYFAQDGSVYLQCEPTEGQEFGVLMVTTPHVDGVFDPAPVAPVVEPFTSNDFFLGYAVDGTNGKEDQFAGKIGGANDTNGDGLPDSGSLTRTAGDIQCTTNQNVRGAGIYYANHPGTLMGVGKTAHCAAGESVASTISFSTLEPDALNGCKRYEVGSSATRDTSVTIQTTSGEISFDAHGNVVSAQ